MVFTSSQVFEERRKCYLCSGFLVIWYFEGVTILAGSISVHAEGVGCRFSSFSGKTVHCLLIINLKKNMV